MRAMASTLTWRRFVNTLSDRPESDRTTRGRRLAEGKVRGVGTDADHPAQNRADQLDTYPGDTEGSLETWRFLWRLGGSAGGLK